MTALAALPDWAALTVAALVFAGAMLALIGALGLLRLRDFYSRVHAPTLATTLGLYLLLAGTALFHSLEQGRPVLQVFLIGVFVTLTTPITLMLLSRAALARDRVEGAPGIPPPARPPTADDQA